MPAANGGSPLAERSASHLGQRPQIPDQRDPLEADTGARSFSEACFRLDQILLKHLQQALTDKLFADLSKVPVLQKATVLEWQKAPITVPLTKVPGEAHMVA